MLEWRFAPKTSQLLVSFAPDFLDNVFHFGLAPGIAPCGGKDARRITGHQWFERGRFTFEHRGYKLRIALLHRPEIVMGGWKSGAQNWRLFERLRFRGNHRALQTSLGFWLGCGRIILRWFIWRWPQGSSDGRIGGLIAKPAGQHFQAFEPLPLLVI